MNLYLKYEEESKTNNTQVVNIDILNKLLQSCIYQRQMYYKKQTSNLLN